jgi:hypothetical protein
LRAGNTDVLVALANRANESSETLFVRENKIVLMLPRG